VGLHAHENVLEIREGVDALALGGLHERVKDREVSGRVLVAEESEFFLARATIRSADSLALLCAPCEGVHSLRGEETPPGKLSLQPEALGAAHEVTT
jgi:hypothetical protein